MIDEQEDVSPDSLMGDFRGKGLVPIVVLTVVVHLVVFGGTSFGYLKDTLMGPDKTEMSDEEKSDAAFNEATIAIREIAEKYGISPQDVSDRFSTGGSRTSKIAGSGDGDGTGGDEPKAAPPTPPESTGTPDGGEDGKTKSEYEKSLETVAPPPAVPDLNDKEEEDLF